MKTHWFKQNLFLLAYILFVLAGAVLMLTTKKGELELYINQNFSYEYAGLFFRYVTNLGDGLTNIFLIGILLFIKFRYAFWLSLAGVFQLLFVQINKRYVFSELKRPIIYFEGIQLNFVEGITIYTNNSFPSGHTTTAFSIFFLLSLIFTDSKPLQFVCFIAALLVGISRIYLMQHFFIDVYFGAFFGILSSILAIAIVEKFLPENLLNRKIQLISRR